MIAALFGFFIFNIFPARVFPGDVLTYAVGAFIAAIAIMGNLEKIAIIFFVPYGIESILKMRGRLKKHSFGIPSKDGSLEEPYGKIYGLEHFAIRVLKKIKPSGKVYEKDVVLSINLVQTAFVVLGLLTLL
jgi:UDP-N-acetylglucosamine--dolichyl-phosphate N-acetylglucosaminephosphotransferase